MLTVSTNNRVNIVRFAETDHLIRQRTIGFVTIIYASLYRRVLCMRTAYSDNLLILNMPIFSAELVPSENSIQSLGA